MLKKFASVIFTIFILTGTIGAMPTKAADNLAVHNLIIDGNINQVLVEYF